jgi:hypothetical protein
MERTVRQGLVEIAHRIALAEALSRDISNLAKWAGQATYMMSDDRPMADAPGSVTDLAGSVPIPDSCTAANTEHGCKGALVHRSPQEPAGATIALCPLGAKSVARLLAGSPSRRAPGVEVDTELREDEIAVAIHDITTRKVSWLS